jgi:PII-like signaling protein
MEGQNTDPVKAIDAAANAKVSAMNLVGSGTRVRIYFGEHDRHQGKALWSAFLDFLRAEGAAGATVLRGVGGFGAHSHIHTARLVELSSDLPLVLEWVDTPERVARLLPQVVAMLDGGLVTTDPVEIVRYAPHERKGQE